MDNVSEHSHYSEEVYEEISDEVKSDKRLLKFVELNDASVQRGFERLSRLLQIKRLPLDKIEDEILGNKIKHNHSIKIG